MIDGEPYIVERDGHCQLVDASGTVLVCRRLSPYAHGCYHRIDLDQFAHDGVVTPRCKHVTGSGDDKWILRRRTSLAPTWDGCQYRGCYGDETVATGRSGPQLATTLKELSPEEFEAAVADHRSASEGGGCV